MTQMQLPAFLQNSTRAVAASALAGLSQGSPPQISIRQNRFRLVDAGGQEKLIPTFHLDVVIADANPHISKTFYKEAYDPTATDNKPPPCWSDNGQGPSEQALEPQHATCAACPQNAWGSAMSKVTGKGTKACNDVKKLACLVPEHAPGVAFMLRVPPASLKGLSAYVAGLSGQVVGGRRLDVTDVITRITFDAQTQGVLNFQAVGWIDEEIFKLLEEKGPNPYPQLTGANDKPRMAALPAPAAAPALPPVQEAPPFQPAATAAAPAQGFGQAQANGFATTASPSETPEETKRKRRTKAEMEAARAAEQAAQLQGSAQGLAQGQHAQNAPAQFGIVQNAPAPDDALGAAIANAFNLPMN